jgi:DNA end-binding protein Ku
VIREAMRSKAVVALGRVVLSKRERVMALEPFDKGLIGTTLHYPYEVRHATDYFGEIPDLTPAPELLRLATHILDSKTASFAPAGFRDRYEEALLAHLKAKQAGLPPQPQQSFAAPRRAINLIEALRLSIAEDQPAPRRAPPARKGRLPAGRQTKSPAPTESPASGPSRSTLSCTCGWAGSHRNVGRFCRHECLRLRGAG